VQQVAESVLLQIFCFVTKITIFIYFRFNKGALSNVLEFLLVPGYYVDYRKVFQIPEPIRSLSDEREPADGGALPTDSPIRNKMHSPMRKVFEAAGDHGNCDPHDHSHSHGHTDFV
jgi:hypothetical protein